jgi:hypothetical protein
VAKAAVANGVTIASTNEARRDLKIRRANDFQKICRLSAQ